MLRCTKICLALLHQFEPSMCQKYLARSCSFPMGKAWILLQAPHYVRITFKFVESRAVLTSSVFSGARNFELLSAKEQEFAVNTTVQYAPRAYEWMRNCKASPDGLTIEKVGRETPLDQLPPYEWDKVQSFPVCYPTTVSRIAIANIPRWSGKTLAMANHICRSSGAASTRSPQLIQRPARNRSSTMSKK